MIEINVKWLPDSIIGITLFPFILYRIGYRNHTLELHERYHWHDILRWGIIPWYITYIVLWVFYRNRPAREHPLERKAYEAENE